MLQEKVRKFHSRREGQRNQEEERCACVKERQGKEDEAFFCLPVEMTAVREEEERDRFVCISLKEMECYYRYSQCCQQLHSEFDRGVCHLTVCVCVDFS